MKVAFASFFMENFEPKVWQKFFENHGLPKRLIKQYVAYVKVLFNNDMPPIFELEHLSTLLKTERSELVKMINSSSSYYRNFSIPKRSGGKRVITAPYPSLLSCQRWILDNILSRAIIHGCAHGFQKNRSIFTNAESHLGQRALFKLDIKDFFPSIPFSWIICFFHALGYAKNVSFYLSSLCSLNDGLPQGAATSPALSNIVFYETDKRLLGLAKSFNLTYTRYADDLTFSGDYISQNFQDAVNEIIYDSGFEVNQKKTRLIVGAGKKIVTGISVNGDEMKIPNKLKRSLRQEFYYIKKFGLVSHIAKLKISNPSYLYSLIGKFSFWRKVENNNPFPQEAFNFLVDLLKD